MKKGIMSTYEVAKILLLSPRMVAKLCDSGEIKSWRKPNSNHRMIPYEDVHRYAIEKGYPIGILPTKKEDLVKTIVFGTLNLEGLNLDGMNVEGLLELIVHSEKILFVKEEFDLGYAVATNINSVDRIIMNHAQGTMTCKVIMDKIKELSPEIRFECIAYPDCTLDDLSKYSKVYRVEELRRKPYLIVR